MISLLISLMACGPSKLETTEVNDTQSEQVDEIPTEFGVIGSSDCMQFGVGDKACNIVLYDQDKDIWQLKEQNNKIVVLDFSAMWCGPCQFAGSYTQQIQDQHPDVIMATLLIDGYTAGLSPTDDELDEWVSSHEITTAPVLYASRDLVFDQIGNGAEGYNITGFPTYVYIDKNGIIQYIHTGFGLSYVNDIIKRLQ
tara:strand:- start:14149 stop:14739 length:591 start_codon:yes stop_codon:yes gene_type:complete